MAVFVRDSFTDNRAINITAHTGEVGATWTEHPQNTTDNTIDGGGLIGGGHSVPSGTPPSANYCVDYDLLEVRAKSSSCFVRRNPTTGDGYVFFYNTGAGTVKIARQGSTFYSSSVYTKPATFPGRTHIRLSVQDEGADVRLKAFLNGVEIISWLDTNANKITSAGVPAISPGGFRLDAVVENFTARDLSTTDTIEICELPVKKVLQRNTSASSTSIEFRGTYSGSPSGVEVQILDASDGTTVIQDWSSLSSATLQNGFWKGNLAVPNGGWYIAKARFVNNTSVNMTQANKWGVGVVVLATGQSNMNNIFSGTGGTKDDKLAMYNIDQTGFGICQRPMSSPACQFGNDLISKTGLPVMIYNTAVSGSALLNIGVTGWADPSYTGSVNTVLNAAFAGGAEFMLWSQGEQEAYYTGAVVEKADYIAGFETLATRISASYPGIKFVIQPLGMCQGTAYDDTRFNNVRWAHIDLIESSASDAMVAGPSLQDMAATGSVHFDNYTLVAARWADIVAHHAGGTSSGIGATITGYIPVSGTVVDVKITHDEGSDFTPTTGINGFEVFDGASPVTISSAVRQDVDTIRLTLASSVASPSVYYVYGVNQAATNYVKDNSTAALPLRPYSGALELAIVDDTAPVLTDATATATGQTTATASVSTDDGNGTLYFLASTNATESAATVKAALSQSVTAVGEQTIILSGLDADTTYYLHFVQINGASLESAVVSTAAWTTPAIVYPELSATAASVDAHSVTATVTTDTAGGTIYGVLSESATPMAASAIVADPTDSADVEDVGEYALGADELDPRTTYYWHIVHVDGDDLASNVLTIPVTTLDVTIALAFADAAPATLLTVQVWDRTPTKIEVESLYTTTEE